MARVIALGLFAVLAMSAAPAVETTFNKDVLPLLQKNCQECHRPGEPAPMSLLTYKEARPWAKAMRTAVLTKKMPPWFADPAHGKFANDRRLSQADIDTLVAWADSGAKEGNPTDAPAAITFAEGWNIGTPDVILKMPTPFHVPASGTIDYTWILVPTGFTEDKWIEKIEVRPTARSVVHHAVLYEREAESSFMKKAIVGEPFFPPGRKGTPPAQKDTGKGFFEFQFNAKGAEIMAVYVPGGLPYECKPGQARLMKAGSDLVYQMHYTANGKATDDQTEVGIVFAKRPPRERVFNTFVANPYLRIPPEDPNFEVRAALTLQEDAEVLALFPHMHVRGKAFEYRVTYPTGETEVLLNVPKYDFNWQLTYQLKEPKKLPKGTILECIAHFDNSANNPANPDPKQTVPWGDQTWDEMLAGFIDFVVPIDFQPADLVRPKPAIKAELK